MLLKYFISIRTYNRLLINIFISQLSAYSKHLYVHNEEQKVHKCDDCEKTFSHSYMLKQHKLHHTGLRPFSCSVCLNSFKSQSDLCTHVKVIKLII